MKEIKTVAVLTSGGDAPGMNAALRAVVRTGLSLDMEVYGITHGLSGLLDGEIEKMNHANELRRNKMSKKAKENLPVIEAIKGVLTDEPQTATVIGEKVGISTQKASALLRQIVEAGDATKVDVKIKGKGTQKGYLVG